MMKVGMRKYSVNSSTDRTKLSNTALFDGYSAGEIFVAV